MAAPPERTIKDLNGQWVMNRTLSDALDPMLQLQNISWFIRTALGYATVTLHVKQFVNSDSTPQLEIGQVVTGGIKASTERRILDWTWREHNDKIFGAVKGRSHFCKLGEIDGDEWLKQGWQESDGDFIHTYVESQDNGWTVHQVWGFELIKEERRHVRRVLTSKGEEAIKTKIVYDFRGAAATPVKEDEDGLAYEE